MTPINESTTADDAAGDLRVDSIGVDVAGTLGVRESIRYPVIGYRLGKSRETPVRECT